MTWQGDFVSDQFQVELIDHTGVPLRNMVGLALRVNPKRAHLLVSNVLGKHVPTDPHLVLAAGRLLAVLVSDSVREITPNRIPLLNALADSLHGDRTVHTLTGELAEIDATVSVSVLGYAETATALGATVAQKLHAPYIHSTRYPDTTAVTYGAFEESHSHATAHSITPQVNLFDNSKPVVLVDDELTTGNTALNTIRALEAAHHHDRYIIASLVDLRDTTAHDHIHAVAAELGTRIDVVALSSGNITLPENLPVAATDFMTANTSHMAAKRTTPASIRHLLYTATPHLKNGVTDMGDHANLATAIAHRLNLTGNKVLFLGLEEDMFLPLLTAAACTRENVTFSTTTRSPAYAFNHTGYAIRDHIRFEVASESEDTPTRYAYNLGDTHDEIVILLDDHHTQTDLARPGGLLEQLRYRTGRITMLHPTPSVLPAPLSGPTFGSYTPEDVSWLLKDLSSIELEAPIEEREEAVQLGGAHYSESLPVEYQPSAAYQELFQVSLSESAGRLADAVATVSELILRQRPKPVLVSLARAGVPIGVLIKRYLEQVHSLEVPHYAVSIIRGKGIDTNALTYLATNHDPTAVIFVDGWTGKGAIVNELREALTRYGTETGILFPADLAVLADPGHCVDLYGTREDYLIPSACLNSTVSGLISRTVQRDDLIGPGDYHGAKFYREFTDIDQSQMYIDQIAAHFDDASKHLHSLLVDHEAEYTTPDFSGWQAVERISQEYGINNVNLVKPGVGETTRVLLRRVPWRILIRPDQVENLQHVLLLAEQRGVPVNAVENLPYSCVGLIHPQYTRGATGFDGKKVD